jgi:glutathione synthase/RimK-type ligase-like ATP-grasp enzyme
MRGRDGRCVILEVNSIPAWKALQRVARIDIAQTLVDHVLSRLSAAGPQAAAV